MTGPICMESVVANFTNPLPPIPLTEIESQMISRSWRLANSAETVLGAAATRVEDEALGAAADRYVGIEVMDLFVRAVQRAFDRFASDGQRQPDFAVGFRERRARMSGHGLEPPLGRQGRSPLFLALSGSELGEQVGRLFVGAQAPAGCR